MTHLLRKSVLPIIILSSTFLSAQVSVEFSSVNEYAFSTKEALNLIIVNTNSKAFRVFIEGRINDGSGQPIAEFKSSELLLNTGSNIVNPMTVTISSVNYLNNDIAEIESRTGTYPSGNYTVCVRLQCATADCDGAGQNAAFLEQAKCMIIHVENPTPLILVNPENDSEIDETRPMFTWIPPSPVAGSSSLNYTLILVEIMEGQNKADALTINRPLIQAEGLENPLLVFPSDLDALEPGKTYAWQVQAYVGRTPVAKSEQWKFKIKKDTLELKKVSKDQSFIEIKGQTGTSLFYAVGELKLRHVVRLETGEITLTVTNKEGKVIRLDQSKFKIQPGDNRLVLDLEASMNFKHGETYTLNGKLLNGELFTIKFVYINPKLLSND